MNYQQYQNWRDEVLDKDTLDLGNLNVFSLCSDTLTAEYDTSQEVVLKKWSSNAGFNIDPTKTLMSTGVRDMIQSIAKVLFPNLDEIWIPNDVYPVYSKLFTHHKTHTFSITELQYDVLDRSSDASAILIPNPLHPVGRYLTKDEEQKLAKWLDLSSDRWLLMDTVYDYEGRRFLEHERCIVLRSMSKAWLCRKMFGVAEMPAKLLSLVNAPKSSPEHLKLCLQVLESQSNRPRKLQESFVQAWIRTQKELFSLKVDFTPPETGYLAVLPYSYCELYEKGIIAVPISVFGSDKSNLSVISCIESISHE